MTQKLLHPVIQTGPSLKRVLLFQKHILDVFAHFMSKKLYELYELYWIRSTVWRLHCVSALLCDNNHLIDTASCCKQTTTQILFHPGLSHQG